MVAGLKEERVCIQLELAPESIPCLLFIFALKRYEPKSHLITFILMGKGVMVFAYFCPLLNGKHVCQELERETWIYSEKTNHSDSFTPIVPAEVCSISEFERGKKKSQNVKLYLQNVVPTDVKNTVSLILPSL